MGQHIDYFEDIDIGDDIEEIEISPTTHDVVRYVTVAHMQSGRFTDDDYARNEGLPGAIIPGNMSLGFLSRMVTDFFPKGTLKMITANFRSMVPHNTPLVCSGVITEKIEQDGENLVFCDILLSNEDGDRYVQGTAQVALPKRDDM